MTSGLLQYSKSGQLINLEVKRAFANASAAGDTTLVAAVTGHGIRVIGVLFLAGDTATSVTFKSGSTAISAAFTPGANGGAIPNNDHGWFQTTRGAALVATLGAGSTVGIQLLYVEVPLPPYV